MNHFEAAFRHGEPMFSRNHESHVASLEKQVADLSSEVEQLSTYISWLITAYNLLPNNSYYFDDGTLVFREQNHEVVFRPDSPS